MKLQKDMTIIKAGREIWKITLMLNKFLIFIKNKCRDIFSTIYSGLNYGN